MASPLQRGRGAGLKVDVANINSFACKVLPGQRGPGSPCRSPAKSPSKFTSLHAQAMMKNMGNVPAPSNPLAQYGTTTAPNQKDADKTSNKSGGYRDDNDNNSVWSGSDGQEECMSPMRSPVKKSNFSFKPENQIKLFPAGKDEDSKLPSLKK